MIPTWPWLQAEAIYNSIDQKLKESSESELDSPVQLPKVVEQSDDIMLALQFNDTDGDELYRIYVTGFRKHGKEWQ